MDAQLTLLETQPRDWRLDDHTRAVGRRGIADARRALAAAQSEQDEPGTEDRPADRRPAA